MNEIDAFIEGYTSASRSRIEFNSNGERGADARDANVEFRWEVYRAVRAGRFASDELIRDLYDAESKWSAAAWCVWPDMLETLASELLRRGGEDNVRHYLVCMWRGQDCALSSMFCLNLSATERTIAASHIERLADADLLNKDRWLYVANTIIASDGKHVAKTIIASDGKPTPKAGISATIVSKLRGILARLW